MYGENQDIVIFILGQLKIRIIGEIFNLGMVDFDFFLILIIKCYRIRYICMGRILYKILRKIFW